MTDRDTPTAGGPIAPHAELTMEILQPVRYRLEFGQREPLSLALYRVCLFEIDDAIASIRQPLDRAEGVHAARKAMKRIRAMLRMVRDEIGPQIFRAENTVMRDVGRVLSPVRTAHVLWLLAREVTAGLGDAISETAEAHLLDALESISRREATAVLDDEQTIADALTTLLVTRSRFESWPVVDTDVSIPNAPRHRIPDSFAAIEPGIRRVYRRGRRAMAHVGSSPTAHTFHEWRKRVKYLQYQMEALHLVWPEVIGGEAEALGTLGETLGEEHDLAELGHLIMAQPALVPDDAGRRNLLVEIARRRLHLQTVAMRIGATTFHEQPRDFTARIGSYWAAARS